MEQVLLQLCENLTGDAGSDDIYLRRIVEGLKSFREEAVMIDCSPYNAMLEELKKIVFARSFQHLWLLVKTGAYCVVI